MLRRTHLVTTSELVAMIAAICLWGAYAMAADWTDHLPSTFGRKETMDGSKANVQPQLRPSVQPNSCIPF
jgi:hypothetical protein